jgi:hypothetical protein
MSGAFGANISFSNRILVVVFNSTSRREAKTGQSGQSTNRKGEMSRASH